MANTSHNLDSLKVQFFQNVLTVDEFRNNRYRIILEIAKKININEVKPHTATFQKTITIFPRNKYLESVTILLLDHLLTQLNVRFDSISVVVYGGLIIIPAKRLSFFHENIDWRLKFRPLAWFSRSDLPFFKALKVELDLLEVYWLNDTRQHFINTKKYYV